MPRRERMSTRAVCARGARLPGAAQRADRSALPREAVFTGDSERDEATACAPDCPVSPDSHTEIISDVEQEIAAHHPHSLRAWKLKGLVGQANAGGNRYGRC